MGNKILSRRENGKLFMNTNEAKIIISELYAECKTVEEVEFVRDNMEGIVNCEAENREEKIEDGNDN